MLFEDNIVHNIYEATDRFLKILIDMGLRISRVIPKNHERHRLIIANIYSMHPFSYKMMLKKFRFYLVYQREWFLSFSKYYGYDDVGATINLNLLNYIIKSKVDKLVFCNKDGNYYWINPVKMLDKARENNWIRKTVKTGETVVNYPITLLQEASQKTLLK